MFILENAGRDTEMLMIKGVAENSGRVLEWVLALQARDVTAGS